MSFLTPNKPAYGNRIAKENGYDANSYTYIPVAIIGAGESGIAMGCRLKEELGFDQFRIFDRQSGIGGTWWINRYPGVACDVPAAFYSFSFAPNYDWSSLYPPGPEIVKYLTGVCEKYQILDKIALNSDVSKCVYNNEEGVWEITVHELVDAVGDLSSYDRLQLLNSKGEQAVFVRTDIIRAKVLLSAVGGLVEPNRWPAGIPGQDVFKGEIFHSARWRYDVDLKDKDVVVLGSGCSAAQFVPRLIPDYGAKSVTQIMRSPPWVVPKERAPLGEEAWAVWGPWLNWHVPGFAKLLRYAIAAKAESDWRLFGNKESNKKFRADYEQRMLKHMKSVVPEKYWSTLTPDYGVGCKRRIFDKEWFESLNDSRIELTTQPLTRVNERSVTVGPGATYPVSAADPPAREIKADVIVLANGFEVLHWFHPLEVVGRNKQTLAEVFDERGGPQMYMGAAMDGFPNFFTIFGPNTATGHSSVILATENMVELTLKLIGPVLKGDATAVEVKKEAEIAWTTRIQRDLKDTVWEKGGCNSWYKDKGGWNSTVYPYSQIHFTLVCAFPKYRDWAIQYTTKGLLKLWSKRVLKLAALVVLIRTALKVKRGELSVEGLKIMARFAAAGALGKVARTAGTAARGLVTMG